MNSSLLPHGLKDLLPEEAEKEAHIINLLMGQFSKFGYQRVKPPLVEFEETLLAGGVGKTLSRNTFRLMDPVSGQMMGVRADTTAQIIRIANTRLSEDERPLRLCYAADILKINGSQLRAERQFCQVGCEMIGDSHYKNDVEICLTALTSLSRLDIENLSIDLTIPVLVNELFNAYAVEPEQQEILNKFLQKRDRDALVSLKSDVADILVSLLDASGTAPEAIEKLENISLPKEAAEKLAELKTIYNELRVALDIYGLNDVSITIDLIERQGFDYKSGVSFTLFSPQARGELGRGGRYCVSQEEDAVGFTLYMDSLLAVAQVQPDKKEKKLSADASWEDVKKEQDAGYQVFRQKQN